MLNYGQNLTTQYQMTAGYLGVSKHKQSYQESRCLTVTGDHRRNQPD